MDLANGNLSRLPRRHSNMHVKHQRLGVTALSLVLRLGCNAVETEKRCCAKFVRRRLSTFGDQLGTWLQRSGASCLSASLVSLLLTSPCQGWVGVHHPRPYAENRGVAMSVLASVPTCHRLTN